MGGHLKSPLGFIQFASACLSAGVYVILTDLLSSTALTQCRSLKAFLHSQSAVTYKDGLSDALAVAHDLDPDFMQVDMGMEMIMSSEPLKRLFSFGYDWLQLVVLRSKGGSVAIV